MNKITAATIFIENYIDEKTGWSEIIFLDDLIKKYGNQFMCNNGCQWARKGSLLDNNYILKRFNAKEMGITDMAWNKVVAVQTQGFREKKENHSIPQSVKNLLKNKVCAVLGVLTSDMEIDHKNGKYNDDEYNDNDFQPLTKSVNDAKREHCKKCNATGCRFKASMLGYSIDYIEGDEKSTFCKGCYWYDPQQFNRIVSSNYIRN